MYEIVNNKKEDEIRAKQPPTKDFIESHKHYCKTCNDRVCSNKGKDRWAYCAGGDE